MTYSLVLLFYFTYTTGYYYELTKKLRVKVMLDDEDEMVRVER